MPFLKIQAKQLEETIFPKAFQAKYWLCFCGEDLT